MGFFDNIEAEHVIFDPMNENVRKRKGELEFQEK